MVMKVNWRRRSAEGRGDRTESVAGAGMTIERPRGGWEIYSKRWAVPNLFRNAATCSPHRTDNRK